MTTATETPAPAARVGGFEWEESEPPFLLHEFSI